MFLRARHPCRYRLAQPASAGPQRSPVRRAVPPRRWPGVPPQRVQQTRRTGTRQDGTISA